MLIRDLRDDGSAAPQPEHERVSVEGQAVAIARFINDLDPTQHADTREQAMSALREIMDHVLEAGERCDPGYAAKPLEELSSGWGQLDDEQRRAMLQRFFDPHTLVSLRREHQDMTASMLWLADEAAALQPGALFDTLHATLLQTERLAVQQGLWGLWEKDDTLHWTHEQAPAGLDRLIDNLRPLEARQRPGNEDRLGYDFEYLVAKQDDTSQP